MRKLILYHGDCADGFCSAWIAWRHFKDDAEYVPVQYGQPPPDVTEREVYLLDFSYKRPVTIDMSQKASMLVVLDHHRTAEMELFGLSSGSNCGLIRFDMTKSGARLAWDYFFRDEPIPWLVSYVEDRDLWSWKLPMSKEVSAAIASYPKDFALWEKWGQQKEIPWELVTEGAAILRYQQQQVDNACKNAVEITLDGHCVLSVNATILISEIAGQLAKDRPFAATFFIRNDGKKIWSLRSRDGGVDVSEIARAHGGGGHRNSAGFEE